MHGSGVRMRACVICVRYGLNMGSVVSALRTEARVYDAQCLPGNDSAADREKESKSIWQLKHYVGTDAGAAHLMLHLVWACLATQRQSGHKCGHSMQKSGKYASNEESSLLIFVAPSPSDLFPTANGI